MIFAHVIQFMAEKNIKILSLISLYVNLTTFSGFLFAFGYVCEIAYFRKELCDVKPKMIKTIVKTLFSFYISGLFYNILILKTEISIRSVLKVILLFDIPGYSEFLISFTLILLISLIFFNYFKTINLKKCIIISIISLLSTFLPYRFFMNQHLALLLGSDYFITFPVLQYFIYFVIGIYFSKNQMNFNKTYFILSTIGTGSFFIYYIVFGNIPKRFPPSVFWIVGAMLFIYNYYLISKYIESNKSFQESLLINVIQKIGKNTLYYLIISNILIFSLSELYINKLNLIGCLLMSFFIILCAIFLELILRP